MADVVALFTPTAAKSGYITKTSPSTYDVYANTDGFCAWDYTGAAYVEKRAFFSYDTSSIPSTATVTGLRWKLGYYGQASFDGPSNWRHRLNIGTWIGSSLDSSDWAGGSLGKLVDWPGIPGGPAIGWIDFPALRYPLVNLSGDTDIALWDVSAEESPWGYWQIVTYITTGRLLQKCRLEVTYDPTGSGESMFYNFGG